MPAAALLLCLPLASGFAAESGPSPSVLDALNTLIHSELPALNQKLQAAVPASYGNCNQENPPQQCACSPNCDDLYSVHKKWEYKAFVRWIAGLNTGSFNSIVLANTTTGVTAHVEGAFASLPASIYIGECFTFDKCSILWDNTHGCCGENKKFSVDFAISCNSAAPYLNSITMSNLQLDQFEITEKIGAIKLNIADVTGAIHDVVAQLINQYATQPVVPQNGSKITLVEYLNDVMGAFLAPLCTGQQ